MEMLVSIQYKNCFSLICVLHHKYPIKSADVKQQLPI